MGQEGLDQNTQDGKGIDIFGNDTFRCYKVLSYYTKAQAKLSQVYDLSCSSQLK